MPFTPSHAVVALPFVRTPLVPAAIAIGAMTPDLPLFTRGLPLPYGLSHDLRWLPVTVVLAFALLIVWRCLLRPAVRELAPQKIAARLPAAWERGAADGWRETLCLGRTGAGRAVGLLSLAASLAVGVASHIVWDQFTHDGRGGVQLLPALEDEWGPLTGYKWLQHGSSVLGLVILAIWALLWLTRTAPTAELRRTMPGAVRWIWWLALPAILVIAWSGGLLAFGPLDDGFTAAHLAYRVLPPACGVWGAGTLVLCVVVQARRRASDVPRTPPGTGDNGARSA